MNAPHCLRLLAVVAVLALGSTAPRSAEFRAGAFAQDISPTKFPAPVNGSMSGNFAKSIHDPMNARCLALSDGRKEIIFCVVDACMIPREVCEEAKRLASKATGVPASQMLISATHTHSAATMAAVFQSDPDPEYVAGLPARIAEGLIRAHRNLEPAEIASGKGSDPTQVFNRRWLMKDGETYANPFGVLTDRARMNPGNRNPQVTKPSGPVDPDVFILMARSQMDKRPIGLLANYSLHYVGGNPPISADYFGAFAGEMTKRLAADDARYQGKPKFVALMSNGTSGNINNIDFSAASRPRQAPGEQIKLVAASVADAAMKAYARLEFTSTATLDSAEEDVTLKVRKGGADELARAREILDTSPRTKDGQFSAREAIYARETLLLDKFPDTVPVKLQVQRVGDLSIASIPCEVFVEIGLELKQRTPFAQHFTISLANGYNGYLPTKAHHELGGYETWRARSSYLETAAADVITTRLLGMMGKLHRHR
jgi:neutral ceramidase